MKILKTGSHGSPISIYDSEDEVLKEIGAETGFGSVPSSHHTDQHQRQRSKLPSKQTSSLESRVIGQSQHTTAEVMPQKRKRPTHEQIPISGTKKMRHPKAVAPGSAKSKKKKRKMERRLIEAGPHPSSEPRQWMSNINHSLLEPMSASISQPWQSGGFGFSQIPLHPGQPLPFFHDDVGYIAHSHYPSDLMTSSSPWVTSMAMAAETSLPEIWKSYHFIPNWSELTDTPSSGTQSQPIQHSIQHSSDSVPQPASSLSLGQSYTSSQPIGMKPDQDPSSKHGLYKLSKGPSNTCYIPNPARTLVMEQLPKTHRNTNFVTSWSKSACGAQPVYVSIDPHAGKALVEFSTAELARKAWHSPRLGASLAGLKPHQLKGRPREDSIKVWWYRVDGIGANAGVGEIEEGEIEGDAIEKDVAVPVKKETKKERKARLARERQAKQKIAQQPAFIIDTSNVPAPSAQRATGSVHYASLPLSVNSTVDSQQESNSYRPQLLPLTYSYPQSPVPPAPPTHPSRVSPLPQPAFEAQQYPEHDPSKKPVHSRMTAQAPFALSSMAASRSIVDQHHAQADDGLELESPENSRQSFFPNLTASSIHQASSTSHIAPVPFLSLTSGGKDDAPSQKAPESSMDVDDGTASSHPAHSSSVTLPLEPRAMKNAPKGPSFAKRSLLARQKELEERIAKTKVELGLLTASTSRADTPPSPTDEGPSKQVMEERLRALVLRSQKNKKYHNASASSTSDPSPSPATTSDTAISSTAPTADTASFTSARTLDDLAVTFITETIQTYKGSLASALPILPQATTAATTTRVTPSLTTVTSTKLNLAAKQARLEAQIVESKKLMAKLANAKTKQERDSVLAMIRERSRTMEDAPDTSPVPERQHAGAQTSNNLRSNTLAAQTPKPLKKWPVSQEVGVFIVSDDDDDSPDEE